MRRFADIAVTAVLVVGIGLGVAQVQKPQSISGYACMECVNCAGDQNNASCASIPGGHHPDAPPKPGETQTTKSDPNFKNEAKRIANENKKNGIGGNNVNSDGSVSFTYVSGDGKTVSTTIDSSGKVISETVDGQKKSSGSGGSSSNLTAEQTAIAKSCPNSYCNYCGGFCADSKGSGCRDQAITKCPDETGTKPAVIGSTCITATGDLCGTGVINGQEIQLYNTRVVKDSSGQVVGINYLVDPNQELPGANPKCIQSIANKCWVSSSDPALNTVLNTIVDNILNNRGEKDGLAISAVTLDNLKATKAVENALVSTVAQKAFESNAPIGSVAKDYKLTPDQTVAATNELSRLTKIQAAVERLSKVVNKNSDDYRSVLLSVTSNLSPADVSLVLKQVEIIADKQDRYVLALSQDVGQIKSTCRQREPGNPDCDREEYARLAIVSDLSSEQRNAIKDELNNRQRISQAAIDIVNIKSTAKDPVELTQREQQALNQANLSAQDQQVARDLASASISQYRDVYQKYDLYTTGDSSRLFADCRSKYKAGSLPSDPCSNLSDYAKNYILPQIPLDLQNQAIADRQHIQQQIADAKLSQLTSQEITSEEAVVTRVGNRILTSICSGDTLTTTVNQGSRAGVGRGSTSTSSKECNFGCTKGSCSTPENNFNNNVAHQARFENSVETEILLSSLSKEEAEKIVSGANYKPKVSSDLIAAVPGASRDLPSFPAAARAVENQINSVVSFALSRCGVSANESSQNLDPGKRTCLSSFNYNQWQAYQDVIEKDPTLAFLGASNQVETDILSGKIDPIALQQQLEKQTRSFSRIGGVPIYNGSLLAINNLFQGTTYRGTTLQKEVYDSYLERNNLNDSLVNYAGFIRDINPLLHPVRPFSALSGNQEARQDLRASYDFIRGGLIQSTPVAGATVLLAAPILLPVALPAGITTAAAVPIALDAASSAFGIYSTTTSLGQTAEACTFRSGSTAEENYACYTSAANTVYMALSTGIGVASRAIEIPEQALAANKLAKIGTSEATFIDDVRSAINAISDARAAAYNSSSALRNAGILNSLIGAGLFGTQAVNDCVTHYSDWMSCAVNVGMFVSSAGHLTSTALTTANINSNSIAQLSNVSGRIGESADQLDGLHGCVQYLQKTANLGTCVSSLYDGFGDGLGSTVQSIGETKSAQVTLNEAITAYQNNPTDTNLAQVRSSVYQSAKTLDEVKTALVLSRANETDAGRYLTTRLEEVSNAYLNALTGTASDAQLNTLNSQFRFAYTDFLLFDIVSKFDPRPATSRLLPEPKEIADLKTAQNQLITYLSQNQNPDRLDFLAQIGQVMPAIDNASSQYLSEQDKQDLAKVKASLASSVINATAQNAAKIAAQREAAKLLADQEAESFRQAADRLTVQTLALAKTAQRLNNYTYTLSSGGQFNFQTSSPALLTNGVVGTVNINSNSYNFVWNQDAQLWLFDIDRNSQASNQFNDLPTGTVATQNGQYLVLNNQNPDFTGWQLLTPPAPTAPIAAAEPTNQNRNYIVNLPRGDVFLHKADGIIVGNPGSYSQTTPEDTLEIRDASGSLHWYKLDVDLGFYEINQPDNVQPVSANFVPSLPEGNVIVHKSDGASIGGASDSLLVTQAATTDYIELQDAFTKEVSWWQKGRENRYYPVNQPSNIAAFYPQVQPGTIREFNLTSGEVVPGTNSTVQVEKNGTVSIQIFSGDATQFQLRLNDKPYVSANLTLNVGDKISTVTNGQRNVYELVAGDFDTQNISFKLTQSQIAEVNQESQTNIALEQPNQPKQVGPVSQQVLNFTTRSLTQQILSVTKASAALPETNLTNGIQLARLIQNGYVENVSAPRLQLVAGQPNIDLSTFNTDSVDVYRSSAYPVLLANGYHEVGIFDIKSLFLANQVKTTIGNAGGDHLIKNVFQAVASGMGPNYVIVRLGGDEFAVMAVPGHDSNTSFDQEAVVYFASQARAVFEINGEPQLLPAQVAVKTDSPLEQLPPLISDSRPAAEIAAQIAADHPELASVVSSITSTAALNLIQNMLYDSIAQEQIDQLKSQFTDKKLFSYINGNDLLTHLENSSQNTYTLIKIERPGRVKYLNDSLGYEAGNSEIRNIYVKTAQVLLQNIDEVNIWRRGPDLIVAIPAEQFTSSLSDQIQQALTDENGFGVVSTTPLYATKLPILSTYLNPSNFGRALADLSFTAKQNTVNRLAAIYSNKGILSPSDISFLGNYLNPYEVRGAVRLTNLGFSPQEIETIFKPLYSQSDTGYFLSNTDKFGELFIANLTAPFSPSEGILAIKDIIKALDAAGIPYAISGSFADSFDAELNGQAPSRQHSDIDILIPPDKIEQAGQILGPYLNLRPLRADTSEEAAMAYPFKGGFLGRGALPLPDGRNVIIDILPGGYQIEVFTETGKRTVTLASVNSNGELVFDKFDLKPGQSINPSLKEATITVDGQEVKVKYVYDPTHGLTKYILTQREEDAAYASQRTTTPLPPASNQTKPISFQNINNPLQLASGLTANLAAQAMDRNRPIPLLPDPTKANPNRKSLSDIVSQAVSDYENASGQKPYWQETNKNTLANFLVYTFLKPITNDQRRSIIDFLGLTNNHLLPPRGSTPFVVGLVNYINEFRSGNRFLPDPQDFIGPIVYLSPPEIKQEINRAEGYPIDSNPDLLSTDQLNGTKTWVEEQVKQSGQPISISKVLSHLLLLNGGNMNRSLYQLMQFTKWSARTVDDSFNSQTIETQRAEWMRDHILDEFSANLPYQQIPTNEFYQYGANILDYDWSLANQVGKPYHAAHLMYLLSRFSPSYINVLVAGEYLAYGNEHGLSKLETDLSFASQLPQLNSLLESLSGSETSQPSTTTFELTGPKFPTLSGQAKTLPEIIASLIPSTWRTTQPKPAAFIGIELDRPIIDSVLDRFYKAHPGTSNRIEYGDIYAAIVGTIENPLALVLQTRSSKLITIRAPLGKRLSGYESQQILLGIKDAFPEGFSLSITSERALDPAAIITEGLIRDIDQRLIWGPGVKPKNLVVESGFEVIKTYTDKQNIEYYKVVRDGKVVGIVSYNSNSYTIINARPLAEGVSIDSVITLAAKEISSTESPNSISISPPLVSETLYERGFSPSSRKSAVYIPPKNWFSRVMAALGLASVLTGSQSAFLPNPTPKTAPSTTEDIPKDMLFPTGTPPEPTAEIPPTETPFPPTATPTQTQTPTETPSSDTINVNNEFLSFALTGSGTLSFPFSFEPEDLVSLTDSGIRTRSQNITLSENSINLLSSFISDAKKQGITLVVAYGYRSFQEQESLHQDNPQGAAVAGTSQHQSGFAFDIYWVENNDWGHLKSLPPSLIEIAPSYGIVHPLPWDPPHFVVVDAISPGLTQELIKSGVNPLDCNTEVNNLLDSLYTDQP